MHNNNNSSSWNSTIYNALPAFVTALEAKKKCSHHSLVSRKSVYRFQFVGTRKYRCVEKLLLWFSVTYLYSNDDFRKCRQPPCTAIDDKWFRSFVPRSTKNPKILAFEAFLCELNSTLWALSAASFNSLSKTKHMKIDMTSIIFCEWREISRNIHFGSFCFVSFMRCAERKSEGMKSISHWSAWKWYEHGKLSTSTSSSSRQLVDVVYVCVGMPQWTTTEKLILQDMCDAICWVEKYRISLCAVDA